jgi:hypothetical protein
MQIGNAGRTPKVNTGLLLDGMRALLGTSSALYQPTTTRAIASSRISPVKRRSVVCLLRLR